MTKKFFLGDKRLHIHTEKESVDVICNMILYLSEAPDIPTTVIRIHDQFKSGEYDINLIDARLSLDGLNYKITLISNNSVLKERSGVIKLESVY